MIMKRVVLFVFLFLTFSLYSQNVVRYVVLKDNQWVDIFHSAIDIFITCGDTTYHRSGNTGPFVANAKDKKSLTTVPTNDTIIIGVKITHLNNLKEDYFAGYLNGKELEDAALIEINLKPSKSKNGLSCQLYKQSDRANTVRQQVFFSIDGGICRVIDSILLCDNVDTFRLLYDYGIMYFDSLLLHSECQLHNRDDLNLLLYISHKCYKLPFLCSGNNPLYVFIRNTGRNKYSLGWYDGYCLRYRHPSELHGRRGAFH